MSHNVIECNGMTLQLLKVSICRGSDAGSIIHAHKYDPANPAHEQTVEEEEEEEEAGGEYQPAEGSIFKNLSAVSIEARAGGAGNLGLNFRHSRVPSVVGSLPFRSPPHPFASC